MYQQNESRHQLFEEYETIITQQCMVLKVDELTKYRNTEWPHTHTCVCLSVCLSLCLYMCVCVCVCVLMCLCVWLTNWISKVCGNKREESQALQGLCKDVIGYCTDLQLATLAAYFSKIDCIASTVCFVSSPLTSQVKKGEDPSSQ